MNTYVQAKIGDGSRMPSQSFRQRASNCALLTISVICICILVLCGVMIVREYSLAKTFEPNTCKVNNVTYAPKNISCTFCESKDKTKEKGASVCKQSLLPCIHIDVVYTLKGRPREALLHPDSLQASGPYGQQCSYSVCEKDYSLNKRAVEDYAAQWKRHMADGSTFSCFYNTEDANSVIVAKMHSKTDVVHSMLWPSLVIVVCGVIFLRLEMKRRGMGFCEPQNYPGSQNQQRPLVTGHGMTSYDSRNGGHQTPHDVKQTLLLLPNDASPNQVQCSLLKSQGVISSSMPALDRLKATGDYNNGCNKLRVPSPGSNYKSFASEKPIGSSLSVDGLRLHQVKSLEERSPGSGAGGHFLSAKDKFRQDSTKTEAGSSTGSQGSKIMGLETPV